MKSHGWPPTTGENSHIEMLCFSTFPRRKKRSKTQGVARNKIIFSLFHWAIWGKEGQVEQTEISVQQVRTTDKKYSLKAPHSLGEESSTFQAMLLIRLHFRA